MHGSLETEIEKAARLSIHEGGYAKALGKPTQFAQRGATLLEVNEVRLYAPLRKETKRLARICALSGPEYLHLPN